MGMPSPWCQENEEFDMRQRSLFPRSQPLNTESDEPELTLERALALLDFSKWQKLNQMFEIIDQGLKLQKPIDSHKKVGIRIGMKPSAFTRFRQEVMAALGDQLPGDEDDLITDRTPIPTESGERAWELADWVIRIARSQRY
jgi:hypothetical protein